MASRNNTCKVGTLWYQNGNLDQIFCPRLTLNSFGWLILPSARDAYVFVCGCESVGAETANEGMRNVVGKFIYVSWGRMVVKSMISGGN